MSFAHPFVELGVRAVFGLIRQVRRRVLRAENRRWERADPLAGGRSRHALARDYFGYDIIALILFAVLTPPLIFLWLEGFQTFGRWMAPDLGEGGRLLGPSVWAWSIPALFAGLASVAWPLHLAMSLALAERYPEYLFYTSKVAGFDSVKAGKVIVVIAALIALFGVLLFSSTFTAFLDDRIVIKGVLAAPRSHAYRDIVALRAVAAPARPGDEEARSGHYAILFRDGTLWRSTDGLRDSDPSCDYHALVLAARRSGRPLAGPDIRRRQRPAADCP